MTMPANKMANAIVTIALNESRFLVGTCDKSFAFQLFEETNKLKNLGKWIRNMLSLGIEEKQL